jgi:hypothetical protein
VLEVVDRDRRVLEAEEMIKSARIIATILCLSQWLFAEDQTAIVLLEAPVYAEKSREPVGTIRKGQEVEVRHVIGDYALIQYYVKTGYTTDKRYSEGSAMPVAEITGLMKLDRLDMPVPEKKYDENVEGRFSSSTRITGAHYECQYTFRTDKERTKYPHVVMAVLYEDKHTVRYLNSAQNGAATSAETSEVDAVEVKRKKVRRKVPPHWNKVLAWRFELWHDGRLLDVREISPSKLKAEDLPEDWYTYAPGQFGKFIVPEK